MTPASRGGPRGEGPPAPTPERTSEPRRAAPQHEPVREHGLANDAESLRGLSGFPDLQPRRRRMLRELEDEVRLLRVLVEISRATERSER